MSLTALYTAAGARLDATGHLADFGDAAAELATLASAPILAPLPQYALIRFSGEDSEAFLNGQLSSDVRTVGATDAQYSSYSTPKGRMQASFLIVRDGEDYLLQIASELLPTVQKRLSMFILRSKTRASDTDWVALGVAGPGADKVVQAAAGGLPEAAMQVWHGTDVKVITLEGARYQLLARGDAIARIWQALLGAGARPVGPAVWTLTEIRAGSPWVTQATYEEFVPQMANLELVGGVSFKKGCYPGQEIVARTQYLGKLKRRALRFHVAAQAAAGQDVYSAEMNGQASGKVMLAAPAPQGGFEVLAVVQTASLAHGLHLGAVDGPLLAPLSLPYALDAEPA
ncbi:MAG TPA: folate-binding protein [Chitinolyticbacter sp.]|nr:folate-binding protein [Chitinolyticbacter sp.]